MVRPTTGVSASAPIYRSELPISYPAEPALAEPTAPEWDNPTLNVGDGAGAAYYHADVDLAAAEKAVWAEVNQARAKNGKRALTWHERAYDDAASRLDYFSHLSHDAQVAIADGADAEELALLGTPAWNGVKLWENFLVNTIDADSPTELAQHIVDYWMRDDPAKANILSPNVTFLVVTMEECETGEVCAAVQFCDELDKQAWEGKRVIFGLTPEVVQSGQEAIASAVNNVRVAAGLASLTFDTTLNTQACLWAGGFFQPEVAVAVTELLPQAGFIDAAEELVEHSNND